MKENETENQPIPDQSQNKPAFNPLLNNIFGAALMNQGYLSK